MPTKEITELKDAIRETHGCESLHVESVPVKEVFEGETAWEGTVEVFDLVQYVYNLGISSLGTGTYTVSISIGRIVVGSGTFGLK